MPTRRRVGRGQTPVPSAGLSEILTEHGGSFADLAPGGFWVAGGPGRRRPGAHAVRDQPGRRGRPAAGQDRPVRHAHGQVLTPRRGPPAPWIPWHAQFLLPPPAEQASFRRLRGSAYGWHGRNSDWRHCRGMGSLCAILPPRRRRGLPRRASPSCPRRASAVLPGRRPRGPDGLAMPRYRFFIRGLGWHSVGCGAAAEGRSARGAPPA